MSPEAARAIGLYAPLPLAERLFVRGRLRSAPLEEVAERAPSGTIADVGCGHGLLTALLASRPDRTIVGVDPDGRKIAWARQALSALANVSFEVADIATLRRKLEGRLDAVVVADVLYLLPEAEWLGFLSSAMTLLRPGGRLLLKEAEANGSWKHWKCILQEEVMVRLLGRTRSSGGLLFRPRPFTIGLLERAGFRLEEVADLSRGYSTPHVLYVAVR
ncbi:MAG: class I SAM-dependent methyltransferase [Myxococcales bacterium]|nr:class I SAM-dependent methyltransferase [Myxococcales bacterium]